MKPRICLDWDGTCVEGKWPGMGEWKPGAIEALRELSKHFELVVFSCRLSGVNPDEITVNTQLGSDRQQMRSKLDDAGLTAVRLWDKPYKPPAIAYVDDRAVHYNGRRGAWKALTTRLMVGAGLDLPEEDEA